MNVKKFIKNPFLYVINVLKLINTFYYLDHSTKRFSNHNKKIWKEYKVKLKKNNPIILVDLYGVSETNIARSYFLNILAKKYKAKIFSFGYQNKLLNLGSWRIYNSFNTAKYFLTKPTNNQRKQSLKIYEKIKSRIKTKKQLLNLKIRELWIGIDIYESYLRRCNEPTVDLRRIEATDMIKKGIELVILWQDFFHKHKIAAVVLSHDCYLKHNVPAKLAYKLKIPVYFPNPIYLTYAQKPYTVHSYLSEYKKMFTRLSLEKQKKAILWAKQQLESRLKGKVGIDMPYATKTAFHNRITKKRVLKKSKNIKVLICTHCFYDNPHGMERMFFVDFYEWLLFLGDLSNKTNYDWYIKLHPDPMPGTYKTVRKIIKKYSKIKLIPHNTSHHQLVKEGIDFVLTVYGSVSYEYPLLGAQVINAGFNQTMAYDFNWQAKSKNEYKKMLLNLDQLVKKRVNKNHVYQSYYMHNNYVYDDDLVFDSYKQMTKDLTIKKRKGSRVYDYFLDQWTEKKHKKIIKNMKEFINSGKHHWLSRGVEE